MKLSVSVYDRNGNHVCEPFLLAQAGRLRYTTALPGGFQFCEFQAPRRLMQPLSIQPAYRLVVRSGGTTCWEGRVADIERSRDSITITAMGLWEHLGQRRCKFAVPYSYTPADVIRYVLRNHSPYIGGDFSHIQDPAIFLTGMSWDYATLQQIILESLAASNTKWHFAIWESRAAPGVSELERTVSEGADDAYDSSDDSDNSNTATVLYAGRDALRIYSAGVRFSSIPLTAFTTIHSATLTLFVNADITGHVRLRIYGESASNAQAFSISWPKTRQSTYAYVDIDTEDLKVGFLQMDVRDIVQEIVDNATYNRGAIAFLIRDNLGEVVAHFGSYESGYPASLKIQFGWTGVAGRYFPPYVFPQKDVGDTDYLIYASDTDLSLRETTAELVNSVIAKYGMDLYTERAYHKDSIARYDERENDPGALDAGAASSLLTAQSMRDGYLAAHCMPTTYPERITVRKIYTRYGYPVPPEVVRAGCVVRIADLLAPSGSPYAYFVSQTSYDSEAQTLELGLASEPKLTNIVGSGEYKAMGPMYVQGTIVDFDRASYQAVVAVDNKVYGSIRVAHELDWWLLQPGAKCLLLAPSVNLQDAVVITIYEGTPARNPYFDPIVGHRHKGIVDDGPVLE